MIVESLFGASVWAYTEYIKRGSRTDAQKIQRICRKCGLFVKYDGKEDTIKLLRSKKGEDFTQYIFHIPEGLSFNDFLKKKQHIEDGLNSYKSFDISFSNIKEFDLKGDYLKQIKSFINGEGNYKEVYMEFDKTLKIKVYNKPLTDYLIFDEEILKKCKGWEVPVGLTRTNFIKHDFEKIPHLIVAGTTRYGKSIFLKNVITTLLCKQKDNIAFSLIDLKGALTMNRYRKCNQVVDVAANAEEALETLKKIEVYMDGVMNYLNEIGAENVQEAKIDNRHFIIIDESAELASKGETDSELKQIKVECERIISKISRIGGALGYRLINATQYPTEDTLKRQVKQNCDAKLCFKLQTDIASQVVLGEGNIDAAHLPFIKGRAVYLTDRKHIIQTPMIENSFIERMIEDVQS